MAQPTKPPGSRDGLRFNPPPGWPPPPPGGTCPRDFQPDPSWPPAPAEWQWWLPADPHERIARHRLATAAAVVLGILVLGGVGTVGVTLSANRGRPTSRSPRLPSPRSPGVAVLIGLRGLRHRCR